MRVLASIAFALSCVAPALADIPILAHFLLDRQRWVPLDFLGGLLLIAGAFWLLTPEVVDSRARSEASSEPDWVGLVYLLNIGLIAIVAFSSFDLCGHWSLLALVPAMPVLFIFGLSIPTSFLRPKKDQTPREALHEAIDDAKRLWSFAPRALTLCAILMSLNFLSFGLRYIGCFIARLKLTARTIPATKALTSRLGRYGQATPPGSCFAPRRRDDLLLA